MKFFLGAAIILMGLEQASYASPCDPHLVQVTNEWARPSHGTATATVVYLTIKNKTLSRIELSTITTPAGIASLHSMTNENNLMKMHELKSLLIQPHQDLTLETGGIHIMVTHLTEPLRVGDTLPLHLVFSDLCELDIKSIVVQEQ